MRNNHMPSANAQFDTAAIEAIVREVLRRVTNESTELANPSVANPDDCKNTFECTDKVISLETLRGNLDDKTMLRLKPKTIVTPAARDELRDRKIEIKFDLAVEPRKSLATNIVLGATCNSTGTTIQNELANLGASVELSVDDRVSRLATTISNKVSTTLRGIIVTDQPYTAACVANRNANVRAAVVRDETELLAANSELNPNCVIVDSRITNQTNWSKLINTLNT